MTGASIRVLVADDYEVIREGLRVALHRERDLTVVGVAASGSEALALVRVLAPDVVVLDVKLGDLSGPEVCRRIRQEMPAVRVLMFTAFDDSELMAQSIAAGASGYTLKRVNLDMLKHHIREAFAGRKTYQMQGATFAAFEKDTDVTAFLSPIDQTIIGHVADGLTNKEIAQRLQLSPHTIKDRLEKICRVFHVRSRSHLVAQAMRRKVI